MSGVVQFEKRGAVGLILIDSPPINALGHAVRKGVVVALGEALADASVQAIVLACRGRTFIAGADISEFGKPREAPDFKDVLGPIEQSPKPIVAAIHGTALGGGLEIALACNYRVASPDAKVGLPEVKLGLLPGAGGTQRLPRLIGVEKAAEMITGGDPIGATAANTLGAIDEIIQGDLLEGAIAFAQRVATVRPLPRVRDRQEKIEEAKKQPDLFSKFEAQLTQRSRGGRAPFRCLEAVKASVALPFDEGLAREAEIFEEAIKSVESQALRHVFFAERLASKIPDVPADTKALPVKTAAVLGAGTMGAGIAMVFANAGIQVQLIDREAALVEKGIEIARKNYAATVKKGRLSEAEMAARLARITPRTDWNELGNVDLVIEAVFEEMALKKEIFGRLDTVCKKDAILATNTSTLDVDAIAAATSRPEQVIGLHFFSPANVMRLLEIVRGKKTSKEVVATAMKLSKTLGKVGVLVGVCHGFVGNRMLYSYFREAHLLLHEGALPEDVDHALTRFGFAMGPFAVSDLAGIDVGWRVRKGQPKPAPGNEAGERYTGDVPDRLAEMGRYGQKTGAGFYKYAPGDRTPKPDPEVEAIIVEVSKHLGVDRRPVAEDEILERCLYAMVNEGAKILEEKIAIRAADIDTVWINGYGFPPHHGGPMFYADTVGLPRVLETLRRLRAEHGKIWEPSALLVKLANENSSFAGYDAKAGKA